MTLKKFEELEHHINGRLEVLAELNEYLAKHRGFLFLISWWGINRFVKDQLKVNQRMIEQRAEVMSALLRRM